MSRRFPKTRNDGSFAVRVRFSAAPEKGVATVQSWLSEWVRENGEWVFMGEVRHFGEYFREAPEASLGAAGELCIVFRGLSADRRFWKDWYVRIGRATQEAFPEVGKLVAVDNND